MLDKDQYNQEEYNDYYQQETRAAEISPTENSSSKSGIKILLGLVVLGVAGYFGYKTLVPSTNITDDNLIVHNELEKEKPKSEEPVTEAKIAETSKPVEEKAKVTEKVDNVKESVKIAVGDNEQKMSPEEISKVVQLVMSQMNKTESTTTSDPNTKPKTDNDLMSALSGTDVDSVKESEENKKIEESLTKVDKTKNTTIKKNTTSVDTYNKVNVEKSSGSDELSKLSGQISNLISDKKTSDQTNGSKEEKNYTAGLKKEVVTRKNEMRIIIVKKGDTLGKIAKRAYGNVMEYKKIYKANPDILNRPDRIFIGQKLRIPK
jgi:nucleoid-associated protein YgaU